ncbi:hypothetical protein IMG5_028790 [Ichthyophthirius multifiliis]|uniref:DNA ligase 1 n=1 Tax=Ichthyophthirius multifiliis TaxID=5932 RepID=G0QLC5_ICHMU|nr:hypothetical protein IMG5_028790 [Ichthyophthirius multifiliis]EGR33971.1 hypothetical protein IMG5_028790 [Ichthyophthirius multifiliis]|eukprot:XP_004039275.1 hypothetical protein IMG5_028790 [Ichthyophthirius multifiliis]
MFEDSSAQEDLEDEIHKKQLFTEIQKDEEKTEEQKEQIESQKTKKNCENLRSLTDPRFDCLHDAPFLENEQIPFKFLCDAFEIMQECKGQNSKQQMIQVISKVFRTILLLNPSQIYQAYMFCILKVAPDYEQNELGIGQEILLKAISTCSGKTPKQIKGCLNECGDLGKVASFAKATQKNISQFFIVKQQNMEKAPITLMRVYNDLKEIQQTKGESSSSKKEKIIVKFMQDAKPVEVCFFIRFLEKNLKIGAAEKTFQAGLSKAFFDLAYFGSQNKNEEFSESDKIELEKFNDNITRSLCEFPNYFQVIEKLKEVKKNIHELIQTCKVTVGIPCKPMLAKPTKSIKIILNRFKDIKFTCEFKYDGLRGQIHFQEGKVSIFSRNLENMTETYPDIVKFVQDHIKKSPNINSFILDSEIVAFDKQTNRIKPFQILSTRGRVNVKIEDINIRVCVFIFDLLYLNGQSLLQNTLQQRRDTVREYFVQEEGEFQFAEHIDSQDMEQIQEMLEKSLKKGCEGLMVKTLENNSTYEPAKRSFKWLKLKKDYLELGLGDTLDLVPIAAFYGSGKRVGLYGAYLLACYNEDMERYESVCKIGTGFSDEVLEACYKFFQDKIIPQKQDDYFVGDFKADVWLKPCVVWEVKGADLQISPVYTCGVGDVSENKGIGLRFPRLARVRNDKNVTDSTNPSFIVDLYKQQAVVSNGLEEVDDYY